MSNLYLNSITLYYTLIAVLFSVKPLPVNLCFNKINPQRSDNNLQSPQQNQHVLYNYVIQCDMLLQIYY